MIRYLLVLFSVILMFTCFGLGVAAAVHSPLTDRTMVELFGLSLFFGVLAALASERAP